MLMSRLNVSESPANVLVLELSSRTKSYSSLADQFCANAHSTPPPTVQPLRVFEAPTSAPVVRLVIVAFSCAQAPPPLAYHSQRSHVRPTRPVKVEIQSVLVCPCSV